MEPGSGSMANDRSWNSRQWKKLYWEFSPMLFTTMSGQNLVISPIHPSLRRLSESLQHSQMLILCLSMGVLPGEMQLNPPISQGSLSEHNYPLSCRLELPPTQLQKSLDFSCLRNAARNIEVKVIWGICDDARLSPTFPSQVEERIFSSVSMTTVSPLSLIRCHQLFNFLSQSEKSLEGYRFLRPFPLWGLLEASAMNERLKTLKGLLFFLQFDIILLLLINLLLINLEEAFLKSKVCYQSSSTLKINQ